MAAKKPKSFIPASSSLPSFSVKLRAARILAGYLTATDFAKALEIEAETYRRTSLCRVVQHFVVDKRNELLDTGFHELANRPGTWRDADGLLA